ncbi:hypothetical protein D3C83_90600 [compost metagenome]
MIRKSRLDGGSYDALGLAVGDGHRARVGFGIDGDRLAEIAPQHRPALIGQAFGQGDEGGGAGRVHRALIWEALTSRS